MELARQTARVRFAFVVGCRDTRAHEVRPDDPEAKWFNEWLAAHDREVAANALREAAAAMPHMAGENMHSRWLRARADRIEKGADHDPR